MEGQGDGRSEGSADGALDAGTSESERIRYRTLALLEELLKRLVERHGARMTIGELLAITASMARLCGTDRVSIAEIAEATGLPKQNLSRWARKRIGDSIYLEVNQEDQRMHDLVMLDRRRAQEHLECVAALLGIVDDDSQS
jgi:hypothetical protein